MRKPTQVQFHGLQLLLEERGCDSRLAIGCLLLGLPASPGVVEGPLCSARRLGERSASTRGGRAIPDNLRR